MSEAMQEAVGKLARGDYYRTKAESSYAWVCTVQYSTEMEKVFTYLQVRSVGRQCHGTTEG